MVHEFLNLPSRMQNQTGFVVNPFIKDSPVSSSRASIMMVNNPFSTTLNNPFVMDPTSNRGLSVNSTGSLSSLGVLGVGGVGVGVGVSVGGVGVGVGGGGGGGGAITVGGYVCGVGSTDVLPPEPSINGINNSFTTPVAPLTTNPYFSPVVSASFGSPAFGHGGAICSNPFTTVNTVAVNPFICGTSGANPFI
eukprot:TRINITY_DN6059_c0_g1_i8.p1 TRINITY_DN6059_c0_g1~~TRINITY_DN6059_c0_g1_i8.p1  ORF type:complete len:193 (+),score=66.58 TRINITY_DN6059_c0_g1_i8:139-717(+)